jgi:hypothetical protein
MPKHVGVENLERTNKNPLLPWVFVGLSANGTARWSVQPSRKWSSVSGIQWTYDRTIIPEQLTNLHSMTSCESRIIKQPFHNMKQQYDGHFMSFQANILLQHSFITCLQGLHFTHLDVLLKLSRLQQSLHMYNWAGYSKVYTCTNSNHTQNKDA